MGGAGEEETPTDPPQPVRRVLLTYQRKKRPLLSPPPFSPQTLNKKNHICLCNSCITPDLKSNSIFILKSQWRILLLCKTCLSRIKSGDFCSYCLQLKPDDVANADVADLEFLQCIKCSCHVHRCCLPREHRRDFATWQKLGKGGKDLFFTCIDCMQLPNFSIRNKNELVFELISKEIDADMAIGVLSEKEDENMNLAIQVHLAINGSQRVSKKIVNSNRAIVPCTKMKQRKSNKLRKNEPSLGPIRGNHRDINEKLNSIRYGIKSAVLALESVKSDKIFNKDFKKMDRNANISSSNLRTVNGHDRYEIKYKRKKLFLLGDVTGTGSLNCSSQNEARERKTGTGNLNYLNQNEAREIKTGTGNLNGLNQNESRERKTGTGNLNGLNQNEARERKTGTGNLNCFNQNEARERKTGTGNLNYFNQNEAREQKTGTDENRYEKKYKRKKYLCCESS